MKYRTICISDAHLGSRGCQAHLLCDFLNHNQADKLYLVGDIIDIWAIKRSVYWPQSHTDVLMQILKAAERGTKVYYILGNHDHHLRNFLDFNLNVCNIRISEQTNHIGVDGKNYLVVHGDAFDAVISSKAGKYWTWIGSQAYSLLLWLNIAINKVRRFFKLKYWSFADYCKRNTKRAINFVNHFEQTITDHAKRKGYDGVICGHVHSACIKDFDGVCYMNDGDWVDCCSALVENLDGSFEIIQWTPLVEDINTVVLPVAPTYQ